MPMNRFVIWGLVAWLALAGASAAWAQETPSKSEEPPKEGSRPQAASTATPAERYRDLLKAYEKAQQEFSKAYHAAKTDAERQKALSAADLNVYSYADKMVKIAQDAPKDPVAVEALVWVATYTGGPQADQAMNNLIADHVQDPKIASLCARIALTTDSPRSERFLREVLAKNSGREAKGQACLALGQRLKMQAERQADSKEKHEALSKEAEALLERVTKEFADLKWFNRTLGETARNALNELRNLGIGKTAPEIVGEDIDGKPLKLTDFRGKVVVLDFWGDW
jgi:hypothetical protein